MAAGGIAGDFARGDPRLQVGENLPADFVDLFKEFAGVVGEFQVIIFFLIGGEPLPGGGPGEVVDAVGEEVIFGESDFGLAHAGEAKS